MEGIKNALRAGVDSIEHGFFMDDWCFQYMKEHQVYFVPTLAAPYWIQKNGTAAGIPEYAVRKVEKTIEAHKDTFRRLWPPACPWLWEPTPAPPSTPMTRPPSKRFSW